LRSSGKTPRKNRFEPSSAAGPSQEYQERKLAPALPRFSEARDPLWNRPMVKQLRSDGESEGQLRCKVCAAPIDDWRVQHARASGLEAQYCSRWHREKAKHERYWERKLVKRAILD
jgi:hypothetical protein